MEKPPLIAKVDLALGCPCDQAKQGSRLLEAGYVSTSPKQPPRLTAAAISLNQSHDKLIATIRKRLKGNFIREAKKAESYYCGPFVPAKYAQDIEAINKSRPVRSGGPMRPSYLRSADELRAAYAREPRRDCGLHWSLWFGVFEPASISYEEKLVGYVNLKRIGELGLYSTILGHAEFMDDGIMPQLHLVIMRYLLQGELSGIKWLIYGAWDSGRGKGLQLWKRKAGFDPVKLTLNQEAQNVTTPNP